MPNKTVNLKIDNCQDCPHYRTITSEYTGDSFDMADEDSLCTHPKTVGRRACKGAHEAVWGRPIVVSERWLKRTDTVVPKWCPLP